jgi:peptidylprolyl isomerase
MKKTLCLKTAVAKGIRRWTVALAAAACVSVVHAAATPADVTATGQATKKPLTVADVLATSTPADWRPIDPQSTIYMDLPAGRVIIELAPQFAPHYVANVETLARQGYFNGLWVERVQDNYVAQWGDPDAKKPVGNAQRTVAAEFERTSRGLSFMPLA